MKYRCSHEAECINGPCRIEIQNLQTWEGEPLHHIRRGCLLGMLWSTAPEFIEMEEMKDEQ